MDPVNVLEHLSGIKSLSDSKIFQRIEADVAERKKLSANVMKFSEEAAKLLSTVCKDMPLYTLHNERHVLNVLGWMDLLLGDCIDRLNPLECALCVLAAYAHDLGMIVSGEEEKQLRGGCGEDHPLRQKYVSFTQRYPEERDRIARLKGGNSEEQEQARCLENHLLSEFIRTTHTDSQVELHDSSIAKRIQDIVNHAGGKSLLKFHEAPFHDYLIKICLSHNESTNWLRRQFKDPYPDNHGRINLPLIGLLLRLADIMDFDASRTPSILFHHLGLDRDLEESLSNLWKPGSVSESEWCKHLAITGVSWENGVLTYSAIACPHPIIHKSILSFVEMIQQEIKSCNQELSQIQKDQSGYSLNLPDVEPNIHPLEIHGRPQYEYHDWQFTLEHEEIMRLLMGESLWGDPSICIRELLQNALDALELRELRHKLRKKGGNPLQPVDGILVRDGVISVEEKESPLQVCLSWGEENGELFIRITDNGVGMTKETIEKYFTRIGRSYYRSPDFRQEQAAMREHDLFLTPISQFGIGILSCFMIANRVVVRTCAGSREPCYDVTVLGQGSLFFTRSGTRKEQGTEITLYLKSHLRGRPVKLIHEKERCIGLLKKHFYGSVIKVDDYQDGEFDPALIAGRHVFWPKYPIEITPPEGDSWSIDHRFHLDTLAPIDNRKLRAKMEEWTVKEEFISEVEWRTLDWLDEEVKDASGSRIRICYPAYQDCPSMSIWSSDPENRLSLAILSGFVEAQLSNQNKTIISVNGMIVNAINVIEKQLPFAAYVGCRVWVDIRGPLSPKLTADRGTAIEPEDSERWMKSLHHMWNRFVEYLVGECDGQKLSIKNLLSLTAWQRKYRDLLWTSVSPPKFSLLAQFCINFCILQKHEYKQLLINFIFVQDRVLTLTLALARPRTHSRRRTRARALDFALDRDPALARALARSRVQSRVRSRFRTLALDDVDRNHVHSHVVARNLARTRDFARAHALACVLNLNLNLNLDLDLDLARNLNTNRIPLLSYNILDIIRLNMTGNILQECFYPELKYSYPLMDVFYWDGQIGNALLIAPAMWTFECESDNRTVHFADPDGRKPEKLIKNGYNLCFPMTSIPIGTLRNTPWREDRRYRPIGVLPFLIPGLSEKWEEQGGKLCELFQVDHIYALMPKQDLWETPFEQWTKEDWSSPHNLSLLWDIKEGQVLAHCGVCSLKEIRKKGKPYEKLFQEFVDEAKKRND